jgi:hypothetical protein
MKRKYYYIENGKVKSSSEFPILGYQKKTGLAELIQLASISTSVSSTSIIRLIKEEFRKSD